MSEKVSRGNRDSPASRAAKSNSISQRRGDTPESPNSLADRSSPAESASSALNNHHHSPSTTSSQQRPFTGRGRNAGGFNHGGSYRPRPTSPPSSVDLIDFMLKQWSIFESSCTTLKKTPPAVANGSTPASASPVPVPIPTPTSPRSSHVNSPHRGQPSRYTHQNSTGSNWSANSGGSNRRFSDNGDHSNTGSLRRNNNRGGHGHGNLQRDEHHPWQRGTLIGRKNSPSNNSNNSSRHGGYRGNPNNFNQGSATGSRSSLLESPIDEVARSAVPPISEVEPLSVKTTTSNPKTNNSNNNNAAIPVTSAPSKNKARVDSISNADQYFTPDPPSSPSSTSHTLTGQERHRSATTGGAAGNHLPPAPPGFFGQNRQTGGGGGGTARPRRSSSAASGPAVEETQPAAVAASPPIMQAG